MYYTSHEDRKYIGNDCYYTSQLCSQAFGEGGKRERLHSLSQKEANICKWILVNCKLVLVYTCRNSSNSHLAIARHVKWMR